MNFYKQSTHYLYVPCAADSSTLSCDQHDFRPIETFYDIAKLSLQITRKTFAKSTVIYKISKNSE